MEVLNPLMQNPLAGGQLAGGPSFRQPGDMGRYIAFNDPGQPGAGFSNYQDYLAAGNKPVPMNLKTLEAASNANFNPSPPGGGIMQLPDKTGTISQITQPKLTGNLYPESKLAPGMATVNPIVNNPYGTDPNAITSVAEQQGLNITNTDGLNKFVNNMINNRLKQFFGGIMGMLDV